MANQQEMLTTLQEIKASNGVLDLFLLDSSRTFYVPMIQTKHVHIYWIGWFCEREMSALRGTADMIQIV